MEQHQMLLKEIRNLCAVVVVVACISLTLAALLFIQAFLLFVPKFSGFVSFLLSVSLSFFPFPQPHHQHHPPPQSCTASGFLYAISSFFE